MLKFSFLIFFYFLLYAKIYSLNISKIQDNSTISKIESKDAGIYKLNDNYDFSGNLKYKYTNLKRKLSSSKKNLILGSVVSLKWEAVQPFFKSFEAVGFENCDCIIFASKLSENTIKNIESCGAIVKNIPFEFSNLNINKIRWKMYLEYINENLDKYNLILSTDTRDAIFQQDIFQLYDSDKPFLGIALEDDFLSEKLLKRWIIYAFGEDVYKQLENKRMICAGTIIGSIDKYLQLANRVWEKVQNKTFDTNLHDQAVVSYIIYIEKLFDDCLKISDYQDGYILTLGILKKTILIDSEDNILNGNGEIGGLIHQYDRKKNITEKLRKKFCIEGKVNITKKIFSNKKEKKHNLKLVILFNIFIIIIVSIIIVFALSRFRPIRKFKKSGYKRYKNKKTTKMKKYRSSKFKF